VVRKSEIKIYVMIFLMKVKVLYFNKLMRRANAVSLENYIIIIFGRRINCTYLRIVLI